MSKRRADVEVDSPSTADPAYQVDQPSADPEVVETTIVEPGPQDLEQAFAAPAVVRVSPFGDRVNVGDLEQVIENILHDKLGNFLADIERRLGQTRELEASVASGGGRRKVHTEDLNLPFHMIDGYTVTANSPGAGSIAWTNVHIVYNGVDYTAADGNTALKYTWFVKPGSGTTVTLTSSNTQPVLSTGDTLVFVNNAGVPTSVLEGAGGISPAVGPAAVGTAQIAAGAVGDTQISGVTAAKLSGVLGTGNIPNLDAAKITTGQFADAQIAAVAASKLTGTVADTQIAGLSATKLSGVLATGNIPALDAAKITTGQFADAQIAAVAASKLTGQVADTQIAGLSASKVSGTLAAGNIPGLDATKIVTGAFGAAQIGAGAITPVKLNVMQHYVY